MTSAITPLIAAYSRARLRPRSDELTDDPAVVRRFRATVASHGLLTRGAPGLRVCRVDDGEIRGRWVRGEWVAPRSLPTGSNGRPLLSGLGASAVLYLHGGGYISSTAASYRAVTGHLARLTGLPVFAADYRKAPEHRFPAALDDVVEAWNHVVRSGVLPEHIVVVGDSAGAHLAMGLLVCLAQDGRRGPAGVVTFSPLLDPLSDIAPFVDAASPDPVLSPAAARRCADMYAAPDVRSDPRVAILDLPLATLADFPPVLSFIGSREAFGVNARQFHTSLTEAGVPNTLLVADGQVHDYVALRRVLPEARETLNRAARFIADRVTGGAETASLLDLDKDDSMARWYPLAPTDDAFLETAPVRTTQVLETTVSALDLWDALAADDAVVGWSPAVTGTRWLTEQPHGVGTVREVTVGGAVRVRERFYRWDEGERMTFSVSESTAPGIRRFAEDYIVEATPRGSRLTWIVAVEPTRLPSAAAGPASTVLSKAVGDLVKGLGKRLERLERAHALTST